jgi:hypothetical protein
MWKPNIWSYPRSRNQNSDFMKGTRNKEEYRRASAIKQKLEGSPYRTIARNLDVNYRNVGMYTIG